MNRIKKLALRSETVRQLTGMELRAANGAVRVSGPVSECCIFPYENCTSYNGGCTGTATAAGCYTIVTNCEACP